MRRILLISLALCCCFSFNVFATDAVVPNYFVTKAIQSKLTPQDALNKLKEGNLRFQKEMMRTHDYIAQAQAAAQQGQSPFAFVLNCMDSRSIPALVFDQGIGSIFSAAVAGNVVSVDMLASMEYAVYSGAKLIVIMGHTQCGAMQATCKNSGFGNINQLLGWIQPAVQAAAAQGKLNCDSDESLRLIALQNVYNMLNRVIGHSPYIAKQIAAKQILLVGAIHNIKTGQVEFFLPKKPEPIMTDKDTDKDTDKGTNTDINPGSDKKK